MSNLPAKPTPSSPSTSSTRSTPKINSTSIQLTKSLSIQSNNTTTSSSLPDRPPVNWGRGMDAPASSSSFANPSGGGGGGVIEREEGEEPEDLNSFINIKGTASGSGISSSRTKREGSREWESSSRRSTIATGSGRIERRRERSYDRSRSPPSVYDSRSRGGAHGSTRRRGRSRSRSWSRSRSRSRSPPPFSSRRRSSRSPISSRRSRSPVRRSRSPINSRTSYRPSTTVASSRDDRSRERQRAGIKGTGSVSPGSELIFDIYESRKFWQVWELILITWIANRISIQFKR